MRKKVSKEMLERFKEAYRKAKNEGKFSFVFEGGLVFTSHAEYLIGYHEKKLVQQ